MLALVHGLLGRKVLAQAPSNIALTKYMGKQPAPSQANIPENPSVSMTLSGLCTIVKAEWVGRKLDAVVLEPGQLPASAVSRMRTHVERVEKLFPEIAARHGLTLIPDSVRQTITLSFESENTFPMGSGIASSASSFAAFTLATAALVTEDLPQFQALFRSSAEFRSALSAISRQGSGSSCRSFDGPWVGWDVDVGYPVPSHLPPLTDLVILISGEAKEVSSSEAHTRVKSSPHWVGRTERATKLAHTFQVAIAGGDLATLSNYALNEAMEMHELFHTANPPFSYLQEGSIDLLEFHAVFAESGFGGLTPPIVTLDAGPNVHWIVPTKDRAAWLKILKEKFPIYKILADDAGTGASLVFSLPTVEGTTPGSSNDWPQRSELWKKEV